MTSIEQKIREVQVVLLPKGDGPRRIATVRFDRADASIYVFPLSRGSTYYYGSSEMAERQAKASFDFSGQQVAFEMPHLSIHESGHVHITVNRHRRGSPLEITPLFEHPVGHLATVRADTIEDLPLLAEPVRSGGALLDWQVGVSPDCLSCKLVLRLRQAGEVPPQGSASVPLLSRRITRPVFLCLEVREDVPIGLDRSNRGVTVIAGWNPTAQLPASLEAVPFLYLRAE